MLTVRERSALGCIFGLLVTALGTVAAGCGGGDSNGGGADSFCLIVVHGARVRGRRRARMC